MAFTINSISPNISGNSANTSATSFERLSSGSKINRAGDDAAGLAISQRMTTQLDGFDAAIRNSGDAISSIQVTEGALESLSKNIGRKGRPCKLLTLPTMANVKFVKLMIDLISHLTT